MNTFDAYHIVPAEAQTTRPVHALPIFALTSQQKVVDRATVDRLYAQLIGAGHAGLQPPHDAFWGARYAIVADPDGLCIGLMSPIDEAAKTTPPK